MIMDAFAAYHPALIVVVLWALTMMVLSGLSLRGRTDADLCACGAPKRNYANPVYRAHRAFQNALETSGPFLAATMAAVLTGALPLLVNVLCVVFWLARIAMAVVHIGTENQPMRSLAYGIGWLCTVILALTAIVAAI